MQPIFFEGANEGLLMTEMQALFKDEWILDEEQMGVTKTYYCKTYTKALIKALARSSNNFLTLS